MQTLAILGASILLSVVSTTAFAQTEPDPLPPPLPYKYVGNSFSLKFHRPSCRFAKAMNVRHVQLFHFRREAIEAGEKPCNYCLPQSWGSVQAIVKPPTQVRPATDDQPENFVTPALDTDKLH